MRRVRLSALVLAITLAGAQAAAHVAPSVDDNNRYLKLSPLGDRVRLAYTVFFGEVPGAQTRRTLDTNRDGTISDDEGQRFGDRLAAEVAAALEVAVDGRTQPVAWQVVSVGLGSPRTTGGSFSVDMIGYLCLASAGGRHEVRLRDRFRIPRPGETELKVEDGPGIRIDRAQLGTLAAIDGEIKLVGPAAPLAEEGLDLAFTADARAPVATDALCAADPPSRRGVPRALVIGGAAVLGGLLAAGVVLRRRRHSLRK